MSKIIKWGFGMAPLKVHTKLKNYNAIYHVKNFVLDLDKKLLENVVDEISVVKGLFNRIIRQDQWDWFTINMYMDYPNVKELKIIICILANLRKAMVTKNILLIENNKKALRKTNFILYCNNYLTFDINNKTKEEYIYILSRKEQKDILKIGMTTRNIQIRVNEINSATGVLYPYSARKVYKVKNAYKVEKDIHKILSKYRIRPDREFFKIPYKEACTIIEEYLNRSNQNFYLW